MAREISNSDDILDSRDVIERIEELRSMRDDDPETFEDSEELYALETLAEEASDYAPEWEFGETLIREGYFETYAQELAEDIGAVDPNASWPLTHIDWAAAAGELLIDYTAVDFDGQTYYIR